MKNTRECSFCVMDDGAAPLSFDAKGQCECCRDALRRWPHEYFPDATGQRRFEKLAEQLKQEGRGRPYDCMVGLSGGIDSAYLAHLLKSDYGLRLLAVHIDGGWNSEAAVFNIEQLVRRLGIDLYTYVVEWEEMRDIQLAFLRAGVVNQDIPQDHAFFAMLYRLAPEFGIRTFLSGVNFSTESINQPGVGHPSIDGRHILAIHNRFGKVPLRSYPIMTVAKYLLMTRVQRRLRIEKPLNWVRYDKKAAKAALQQHYGWKEYGTKHSESRFTKFYQEIYLPRKTGFDKRRLHLSNLIVSNQITRDEAVRELRTPVIDKRQEMFDIRYVAKKLQISADELGNLIDMPLVPHANYPNDRWILDLAHRLRNVSRTIR